MHTTPGDDIESSIYEIGPKNSQVVNIIPEMGRRSGVEKLVVHATEIMNPV
jgi:hypothetical protein